MKHVVADQLGTKSKSDNFKHQIYNISTTTTTTTTTTNSTIIINSFIHQKVD